VPTIPVLANTVVPHGVNTVTEPVPSPFRLLAVSFLQANTLSQIGHGSIYALLQVLRQGNPVYTAFAGYIMTGPTRSAPVIGYQMFPSSQCSFDCETGDILSLTLWGGQESSGAVVEAVLVAGKAGEGPMDAVPFYEPPFTGPGAIVVFTNAQPAAGADYTAVTVPLFARWRLRGFYGSLTTSSTAGNRLVTLVKGEPASTAPLNGDISAANQAASETIAYYFGLGAQNQSGLATAAAIAVGLSDLTMWNAMTFVTKTGGLAAADQWSTGYYVVEEWVGPAPNA